MTQLLTLRDVTVRHGAKVAVRSLSLHVGSGEIFGLLGPNGCGKSTTLSAIVGLLPFLGEIQVAGQSLKDNAMSFKRSVGIVPQDLAVYEELSVYQNLDFFARLHGFSRADRNRRIAETLDFVQLTQHGKAKVRTLSGGMQRRLNMACTLLHRPQVLLLDEPTVGLDVPARDAIFTSLRQLAAQGVALVFTTHHLHEAAALCHRLGIMAEGQLIAAGSLTELCDSLSGRRGEFLRWRFDSPHPAEHRAVAGARLESVYLGLTTAERSAPAE